MEFTIPNINYLTIDLMECIAQGNKVGKRLKRLEMMMNFEMEDKTRTRALKLLTKHWEEETKTIKERKKERQIIMQTFYNLNKNCSVDKILKELNELGKEKDDTERIKKFMQDDSNGVHFIPDEIELLADNEDEKEEVTIIKNALTKHINNDGVIYYKMCVFMYYHLLPAVREDFVINKMMEDGDLLFILKGGAATAKLLIQTIPELSEEILDMYGRGGDNDTGFILNPDLPNLDILTVYLRFVVLDRMVKLRDVAWNLIKDDIKTKGFKYGTISNARSKDVRRVEDKMVFGTEWNDLMITSNRLCYVKDSKVISFYLIRFKKPLLIDSHYRSMSEILDISISAPGDYRTSLHFKELQRSLTTVRI